MKHTKSLFGGVFIIYILLISWSYAGEVLKNGNFSASKTSIEPWDLQIRQGFGYTASVEPDPEGVRVKISGKGIGKPEYRPYLVLRQSCEIKVGKQYTLKFRARTDAKEGDNNLRVIVGYFPVREKYLELESFDSRGVLIDKQWKDFEYKFVGKPSIPETTASGVWFYVGSFGGDLIIKSVSLMEN